MCNQVDILCGLLSCQRTYSVFVFLFFPGDLLYLLYYLICDIEHFTFFFTMSFGWEGYSTPCGVGRGRGVLGSPMFLQFGTPVNGRGIVMGGNEGTSGIPLISRAVSPPLSHPVGRIE